MRKLVVSEYVTLDGVMEAPEKWQFPYFSDDVAEFVKGEVLSYGALLLGGVTYDIFQASWPSMKNNEFGIADKMNSMPKFVVDKNLEKADWNNSVIIKKNVIEEIAELKQQSGGDLVILGSATLVQSLMTQSLIDEYRLLVHPIVLGKGKRLFTEESHATLNLTETKNFNSGVVLLRYQPNKE